jgi:putative ABC transport system substrate-binding protein
MRRRTVVLGAAAGAMLAAARARAQQHGRIYHVVVFMPPSGMAGRAYVDAAREQLARHGFIDGRNLKLAIRHPSGFGPGPAQATAREFLAAKPDAVFSLGSGPTSAVLAVGGSTPVVFAWVGDPLGQGFVKDLGRPAGNVTGVTNRFLDLSVKRLEVARELLPSARRLALIAGYFDDVLRRAVELMLPAAQRLELELVRIEAKGGWGGVIRDAIDAGAQAAIVLTPFAAFGMQLTEEDVVRQSLERRFPVIVSDVEGVETGGLISYATRFTEEVRRGGDLLARVLRGEKPGDLAIDQAARFELAINLKTARAIGLKVPRSLLARADRVIE